MHSPEQNRKKEEARAESMKHMDMNVVGESVSRAKMMADPDRVTGSENEEPISQETYDKNRRFNDKYAGKKITD